MRFLGACLTLFSLLFSIACKDGNTIAVPVKTVQATPKPGIDGSAFLEMLGDADDLSGLPVHLYPAPVNNAYVQRLAAARQADANLRMEESNLKQLEDRLKGIQTDEGRLRGLRADLSRWESTSNECLRIQGQFAQFGYRSFQARDPETGRLLSFNFSGRGDEWDLWKASTLKQLERFSASSRRREAEIRNSINALESSIDTRNPAETQARKERLEVTIRRLRAEAGNAGTVIDALMRSTAPVAQKISNKEGSFTINIDPGTYYLAACKKTRDGKILIAWWEEVVVEKDSRTEVILTQTTAEYSVFD